MEKFKRVIAMCLALLMLAGFAACSKAPTPNQDSTAQSGDSQSGDSQSGDAQPTPTQSPEEAAVLKVLTIGNGLSCDTPEMMTLIAKAEGYSDVIIATMSYELASLQDHVKLIEENSNAYRFVACWCKNSELGYDIINKYTMQEALQYDYWDVVVLQAGPLDSAESDGYNAQHIQTIQNYVLDNVQQEVPPIFAWHMGWLPASDEALRATYKETPNIYDEAYAKYNNDRNAMFQSVAQCVQDHIETNDTFQYVIPTATAFENALTGYPDENKMYRNYVYANNLGRVIGAYVWFCKLTGIENLETVKLDYVPKPYMIVSFNPSGWKLGETEWSLIKETVNSALANPYQVTQAQTTAPLH